MRLLIALVLAVAGLVAVPSPAPAGDAPEASIVVVTTSRDDLVASIQTATPGNVIFSVSGPGTVVLLQLKGSYTLEELYADFANVFSGRTAPIRRIRNGATFFGGMFGGTDNASSVFGGDLATGVYQLADLGNRNAVTFEVTGPPETRTMPASAGTVRYTDRGIAMPKFMAPGGWMHLVNQSDEVSLMDVVHVKPGTTRKQVKAFFASNGRKNRGRFTSNFDSTLLLSPGQEYSWAYSLPQGPAVASSFWPREKGAEPQAFHGTWGMTNLN